MVLPFEPVSTPCWHRQCITSSLYPTVDTTLKTKVCLTCRTCLLREGYWPEFIINVSAAKWQMWMFLNAKSCIKYINSIKRWMNFPFSPDHYHCKYYVYLEGACGLVESYCFFLFTPKKQQLAWQHFNPCQKQWEVFAWTSIYDAQKGQFELELCSCPLRFPSLRSPATGTCRLRWSATSWRSRVRMTGRSWLRPRRRSTSRASMRGWGLATVTSPMRLVFVCFLWDPEPMFLILI